MSCKINYKGKYYEESEIKDVIKNDPDVIEKYRLKTKEKFDTSNYFPEEIGVFKQKIEFLEGSINARVVLSKDIESSKTLSSEDVRVKREGRPIIMINPDKIFTTTAIHEFGHVFIDSFEGGLKHPRIKKAYEILKGTPLEAEIRGMYPELEDDENSFAKELITTAIGRRGSEIWADRENITTWEAIKAWMLGFIKRRFGFSSENEVEALTQELLNGKVKAAGMSSREQFERTGEETSQEQTEEERQRDEQKKSIIQLEKTYEEMLIRVQNIYNIYEPSDDVAREKEIIRGMKGRTRFEAISELKEAVDELDKVDRRLGISKYIEWVEEEVGVVQKNLDEKKKDGTLTKDSLSGSAEWNRTFDMIDDMQSLITGLNDDGQLTDEESEKYNENLSRIQGKRSKLESTLLEEQRRVYVEFMTENDTQIRTIFEEEFRNDYKTLGKEALGITEGEYVMEQMALNKEQIEDKARKVAYDQARNSIGDIRSVELKFTSEKNSSSKEIQILSDVASDLDRDVNFFGNGKASLFDNDNKKFRKESKKVIQSKKYEGLYEQTESGSSYLSGEYKAEFYEKKNKLSREAFHKDEAESKYGKIKVNEDLEYTIDGVTKKIDIDEDAIDYRIHTNSEGESFYISYTLYDERISIETPLAVGRSEFKKWEDKNIVHVKDEKGERMQPHEDWLNKEYAALSGQRKETHTFLKKAIQEADDLYGGKGSLTRISYGQEFIKLPSVLKTNTQRFADGDFLDTVENAIREIGAKEKDDFETQENTGQEMGAAFKRVTADTSNRERLRVAVPFRSRLKNNEQSLDLHSIVLMNLIAAKNHKVKSELESTFLIMIDVMNNRKTPDVVGVDGSIKTHASRKEEDIPLYKDKKDILDAKRLRDILESRFYGVKSKDAGKINLGTKKDGTKRYLEVNALTKTWLKFSGWVALTYNNINGFVNAYAGTIQTYIEAIGGEHFNAKDLAIAGKKYYGDVGGLLNDMGSNVHKSRTNLFMNFFNTSGSNHAVANRFEDGTRFQALFEMNTLRGIATAGEHMIQGKIMYATLNHMKVMDKNGKYLDKKGNVVKNKKDAASLDEMIDFIPSKNNEKGIELVLNPKVQATTHTLSGGQERIIREAMNLIKYKINESQGNHDPNIQAAAQREFWGKLIFYLRKWVEDSYLRRWRGTGTIFKKDVKSIKYFYSQDAKANREGYYVTTVRFLTQVLRPAITQLNIEILKTGLKDLAPFQRANLKKMIAEIGFIAVTFLAYQALDEDDDEIDAKYAFRRAFSELSFFMWPPEAIKIVLSPTASIGTLRSFFSIISQGLDPYEEYQQGPHKGRNKLSVRFLKSLPIFSQFMKDSKSSLDYLTNSGGMFN